MSLKNALHLKWCSAVPGSKPYFDHSREGGKQLWGVEIVPTRGNLQISPSCEKTHFDPKHSRPNAAAWTSGCVPVRRLRLWSAGIGGGGVFSPQLHAEAGGTPLASGHMFKPLKIRRTTFLASGCQYIESIAYRNKPTVIATLTIAFWLVSEHFQEFTRPSTGDYGCPSFVIIWKLLLRIWHIPCSL